MKGVNSVTIIGQLGKDPESRALASGEPMCSISVATSDVWKDKTTGERQEKTEWHKIIAFGRLSEVMATYLRKGSKVYVQGALTTRSWDDKDGSKRYSTEIRAFDLQMLDGKPADERAPSKPVQSFNPAATDFDDDFEVPF